MEEHVRAIDDRLWTVRKVSEFLQLQPFTVRSMVRRRRLPAIAEGQRFIRFVPSKIMEWVDEHKRESR